MQTRFKNLFLTGVLILGPGEQGLAFYLSPEDEKIKDSLYKVNGFNALVSDRINLNRTLKDIRHPEYVYFLFICWLGIFGLY
jgi:hypothetical protein